MDEVVAALVREAQRRRGWTPTPATTERWRETFEALLSDWHLVMNIALTDRTSRELRELADRLEGVDVGG